MLRLDMVLLLPCVLNFLTEHAANGLVGALLVVQIVVKTLNLEISRCHLADYVKELHCSTIIFPHSTNQIVSSRRRCRCPSLILKGSLLFSRQPPIAGRRS